MSMYCIHLLHYKVKLKVQYVPYKILLQLHRNRHRASYSGLKWRLSGSEQVILETSNK